MKSVASLFSARSVAVLAIACLLAAVSANAAAAKKLKPRDYTPLMTKAEGNVANGKIEAALVGFNEASLADPTRKEPWLRSAQLQFDAGNYGRAIVAAEEVLKRDPADKVADSVLSISGLRVAAQSLQRLQGNGALSSPTARKEAEKLAATLRATLGTAVFANADGPGPGPVVPRAKPKKPKAKKAATATQTPATNAAAGGNPFDTLGGN